MTSRSNCALTKAWAWPATLACLVSLVMTTAMAAQMNSVNISVDTSAAVHSIDARFVSVALDSSLIREKWGELDFGSKKIQVLAEGLAPCFLRVGGTAADLLIFDPGLGQGNKPPLVNFTMTVKEWDTLNKFVATVGWDLIFGLNVLLRKGDTWDPTNALQLLNYTVQRGFPLAGLELGNEPNALHHVFGVRVSSAQLAQDFGCLAAWARRLNLSSLLIGPDVTQVVKKSARRYLDGFLSAGGNKFINVATFHHYYLNGRVAILEDFVDPAVMDGLLPEIRIAQDILALRDPHVPLWLGETSSAYGGGAPGLSDRFVAGFLWLDKLGVTTRAGVGGVVRQSFYKGFYALLSLRGDPNPDYWLTLLYKRLVGSRVLKADNSDGSGLVRAYAHCSRSSRGGVVVYAMNLHNSTVQLSLPDFPSLPVHVFLLSAPQGDLRSSSVLLNGEELRLQGEGLPPLRPHVQTGGVLLPAFTMAFLDVPAARAPACLAG